VEVLGSDLSLSVGEGVEEREPDGVRLGAGGDLAEDPVGVGFGELAVGVMPEFAGVGVQADLARCLGVLVGRGEQAGEAGAGERVGVAAFGQQPLTAAADEQYAIEVAVGELCLVLTDIEAGDVGVMLRGDEGWRMMERRRVLGNVRTLKRSKGR